MSNPLTDLAKSAVQKIRKVADTVEAYVEAAAGTPRPIDPESFAAEILERLAAELRSKKKR